MLISIPHKCDSSPRPRSPSAFLHYHPFPFLIPLFSLLSLSKNLTSPLNKHTTPHASRYTPLQSSNRKPKPAHTVPIPIHHALAFPGRIRARGKQHALVPRRFLVLAYATRLCRGLVEPLAEIQKSRWGGGLEGKKVEGRRTLTAAAVTSPGGLRSGARFVGARVGAVTGDGY